MNIQGCPLNYATIILFLHKCTNPSTAQASAPGHTSMPHHVTTSETQFSSTWHQTLQVTWTVSVICTNNFLNFMFSLNTVQFCLLYASYSMSETNQLHYWQQCSFRLQTMVFFPFRCLISGIFKLILWAYNKLSNSTRDQFQKPPNSSLILGILPWLRLPHLLKAKTISSCRHYELGSSPLKNLHCAFFPLNAKTGQKEKCMSSLIILSVFAVRSNNQSKTKEKNWGDKNYNIITECIIQPPEIFFFFPFSNFFYYWLRLY